MKLEYITAGIKDRNWDWFTKKDSHNHGTQVPGVLTTTRKLQPFCIKSYFKKSFKILCHSVLINAFNKCCILQTRLVCRLYQWNQPIINDFYQVYTVPYRLAQISFIVSVKIAVNISW